MAKHKTPLLVAIIALLFAMLPMAGGTAKADDSQFFPETGHTVNGLFLAYWNAHGGLAQQGYPISDELQEVSDTDGKTYTMQYFQRAVFEKHPEFAGTPSEVLLSLLGVFYYNDKYGGNAPNQQASTVNPRQFTETGKTLGGAFRTYWEAHGGLAQQGFPISNEFSEVSATDGKTYTVQYFERAVFEYHAEFAGTPNEVLLSLLGVFYYNKKHGTTPPPTVVTGATPTSQPVEPTATPSPQPVGPTGQVLFLNGGGTGQPALVDQEGTIFNQPSFDLGSQNWTHFTSSNGGYLLFYKQSGGAETAKLEPDGSYAHLFSYGFRAGHTHVTTAGGLIVLFDNATTILDPGKIEADGSYQPLSTKTLNVHYADVIGNFAGQVFFYLDSPQIDEFIHYMTINLDSNGAVVNMVPVTTRVRVGADRHWKAIGYVDDTHIFFYNPLTGQYDVREVKSDGTLADGSPTEFGLGWTGFALLSPGGRYLGAQPRLVAYRLDTGAAMTLAFDSSYKLSTLKTYDGPNALAPGWTMLGTVK